MSKMRGPGRAGAALVLTREGIPAGGPFHAPAVDSGGRLAKLSKRTMTHWSENFVFKQFARIYFVSHFPAHCSRTFRASTQRAVHTCAAKPAHDQASHLAIRAAAISLPRLALSRDVLLSAETRPTRACVSWVGTGKEQTGYASHIQHFTHTRHTLLPATRWKTRCHMTPRL